MAMARLSMKQSMTCGGRKRIDSNTIWLMDIKYLNPKESKESLVDDFLYGCPLIYTGIWLSKRRGIG